MIKQLEEMGKAFELLKKHIAQESWQEAETELINIKEFIDDIECEINDVIESTDKELE